MNNLYLLSGWGWSMPLHDSGKVSYKRISESQFEFLKKESISCIGNPAMARILDVPHNTGHIQLDVGDEVLVVYTQGGKLPFDATELPQNVTLGYTLVKMEG